MFDYYKNAVKNGNYEESRRRLVVDYKLLGYEVTGGKIYYHVPVEEYLKKLKIKKLEDQNFKRRYEALVKLDDILLHILHHYEPASPEIKKARDNKIIREIEELESEVLNTEGWIYDEHISDNFRQLVDECKTVDEKYIWQLSLLIQAMEDEFSPILILGESGVGKSKLAEIFHALSKRKENVEDLVELNCGALDEVHIYPVLFGAKKGSFSGSIEELPGKVSEADGGTLFLDEIDRAPKRVQDYLLTFVATKKYQPLGYSKDKKADVIILIGTNKNPKSLVVEKLMEPDFYNRISKRIITIPPLRERKDDIKLIADFCLTRFNNRYNTDITITGDAYKLLEKFPWPGNFSDVEAYLEMILSACKWRGEKHLTPYFINNNPPDKSLTVDYTDFENFENLMFKFLTSWETEGGSFTDEFLFPILSKIYIEQYPVGKNQTEKNELAMSIVGMNGESKKGKLYQEYLKYEKLKSKFNL